MFAVLQGWYFGVPQYTVCHSMRESNVDAQANDPLIPKIVGGCALLIRIRMRGLHQVAAVSVGASLGHSFEEVVGGGGEV